MFHVTFGRRVAPTTCQSRFTIAGSSENSSIQDSTSQSVPSSSLWMMGFFAPSTKSTWLFSVNTNSGSNPIRNLLA